MTLRNTTNVLVLSAAFLIGGGCYLLHAAAPTNTGAVATVDMQKVFQESDARQRADADVKMYGKTLFDRYSETKGMLYLTADELSQYSEAVNADAPTDAQKQFAAKIKETAAKRQDEMTTLSTRKDTEMTDAERARLRELSAMPANRAAALDHIQQVYQNMVNEENEKKILDAQTQVRAAVQKLAKDQGLAQVFDSTAMVYAPVDLTDQAIQRVKKK